MDGKRSVTMTPVVYRPYHPLRTENGERIDTGGESKKQRKIEENPDTDDATNDENTVTRIAKSNRSRNVI